LGQILNWFSAVRASNSLWLWILWGLVLGLPKEVVIQVKLQSYARTPAARRLADAGRNSVLSIRPLPGGFLRYAGPPKGHWSGGTGKDFGVGRYSSESEFKAMGS
jgi:hypothetical protein